MIYTDKEKDIFFSVIIPVFNAEKTLIRCIESVLHQRYKNAIEIIIINDGSTDNTQCILNKYVTYRSDSRKILIKNTVNRGVSSARNLAISIANGKYLSFIDADDFWHENKLKYIYEIIDIYKVSIIAHSYSTLSYKKQTKKSDLKFEKKIRKINHFKLLFSNQIVTPSMTIKKSLNPKFDEQISYCEDFDLWLRLSESNEIYFLDLKLVFLGRQPNSAGGLSSNSIGMRLGEMQTYYKYSIRQTIFLFPLLFLVSLAKAFLKLLKKNALSI